MARSKRFHETETAAPAQTDSSSDHRPRRDRTCKSRHRPPGVRMSAAPEAACATPTAEILEIHPKFSTNVAIMSDFQLEEEHPLALELASLREAALRYQIPELTLALRKLSDKLTTTEETLLARTTELAHAQSELGRAEHDRAAILAILAMVQAAEEERRLADMVLEEYASLVRKLEGRTSKSSDGEPLQSTPAANLAEGSLASRDFSMNSIYKADDSTAAKWCQDIYRAPTQGTHQRTRQTEKLREALEQLSEDISREAYGRRREISLRLSFLGAKKVWRRASDGGFVNRKRRPTVLLHANESPDPMEPYETHSTASFMRRKASRNAEWTACRRYADVPLGSVARVLAAQMRAPVDASSIHIFCEFAPPEYTAATEDSQAKTALEMDSSGAVDAPAVQPITQLAEAPLQLSQTPADEAPHPNIVLPMSETSSHSSVLTAVQSEENLAPQEGPNALPSVTITPAAEETPLPPADATVGSETTATSSSPTDHTLSDSETISAPVPTSIPSIQELSGLDIRDLPSSSPQASPQLSNAAELPSSTAATPAIPLTVEVTNATPSGMLFTPSSVVPPSAHPLVADLQMVKQRYDNFQKAFRDCNLSLKDLKKDIADLPPSSSMTPVLKTAVERLNDVNEDTRVELEIRVADEERIISGYETLLSVPGALSSHEVDESEVRQEIAAFVEGTTPSVAKALQQFSRKLDDLQHDIASIKRSLHELSSEELSTPASVPTPTKSASQGWASWTGGILGGARPVSPAPTFGSVMTTPRARQSSFGAFMHRPSLPNLHSSDRDSNSPFASLDLRTPMPAFAVPQSSPSPSRGSFLLPAPGGRPQQKSRNASSPMYMLGLGLRGSSVGFGSSPAMVGTPSRLARGSDELSEAGSEDGEGHYSDSSSISRRFNFRSDTFNPSYGPVICPSSR
ncbi:hypothetical protein BC629DRAFT_1719903 [Irpex lacteus]|nr:hypothetical protein BC629DRAFT_1719903 [Irpex lacteus]